MLGCFLVALVNGMEGLGTQELTSQATNTLATSFLLPFLFLGRCSQGRKGHSALFSFRLLRLPAFGS